MIASTGALLPRWLLQRRWVARGVPPEQQVLAAWMGGLGVWLCLLVAAQASGLGTGYLALGWVLGGALGNILDRIRFGFVVDFADLHIGDWRPFLVFNVADAAITVGVLVLLVRALLTRDKPQPIVESPHA